MKISRDFIRFAIAGLFNTLVTFVLYCFMVWLGVAYVLANTLTWAVGILVAYLLNSTLVFTSHKSQFGFGGLGRFGLAYSAGLILSTLLLALLVENGWSDPIRAQFIIIPAIIVLNYTSAKYWVFSPKRLAAAQARHADT